MTDHEIYMQRCFQLALMGAGSVAPNPMVGAVLVHEGMVIGEGYHRQFGQPHAEVNCIASVPEEYRQLIQASTLYVSLEPCTHHGKTPPCTDLIIKNKIPFVVVGCRDSFEKVNGTGVERLQSSGIKVLEGVLEDNAKELNRRFFTFHKKQRPYIILKWAQSADHRIAGKAGERVSITSDETNRLVHKWRSEEAAIMVGTQTASLDDPQLTTRLWPGKNPLRVVLDRHLKLPSKLHLFDGSTPTIVINTSKHEELENCLYYKTSESDDLVAVAIHLLYQRQVNSLIVEGGSRLLQYFIDKGIWDEARIITNSRLHIGEGVAAPVLGNASLVSANYIGDDLLQEFRNLAG